jgi:hypothetical protein
MAISNSARARLKRVPINLARMGSAFAWVGTILFPLVVLGIILEVYLDPGRRRLLPWSLKTFVDGSILALQAMVLFGLFCQLVLYDFRRIAHNSQRLSDEMSNQQS